MKESIIKIASNFVKQKFVYAGVPVIIQNSKKEILLEKRNRKVLSYPDVWCLPGGMIDYGEKLVDTAKREVKEELGIDVKIIRRAKNVYENPPTKECKFHMIDIPYYAKIMKNDTPKPKDETSEVKWFKPLEIRKMKLAYDHKEILKGEGLI
jgi:ADP-ribose pyrophosphatase YjhB (NUDIX family)